MSAEGEEVVAEQQRHDLEAEAYRGRINTPAEGDSAPTPPATVASPPKSSSGGRARRPRQLDEL